MTKKPKTTAEIHEIIDSLNEMHKHLETLCKATWSQMPPEARNRFEGLLTAVNSSIDLWLAQL